MNFFTMYINIYFLSFYLLKLIPSVELSYEPHESQVSPDMCQPGCYNKLPPECNRLDIEVHATITKCNQIISQFIRTKIGRPTKGTKNKFHCEKKLHAILKLINQGETIQNNQYVVIDHIFDSSSGQRVSLLNPYVVVIRQKPILQLYGLKQTNVINGEAREQVINKKSIDFSGCDDMSNNPTCGNVRFNGDTIPFSQGFCCSCDEKKNIKRQPRYAFSSHKANITTNTQEFIFNNLNWDSDSFTTGQQYLREKKSIEPRDFNDYRSSIKYKGNSTIIYVAPKIIGKEKRFSKNSDIFLKLDSNHDYGFYKGYEPKNIHARQLNIQVRGGQNCDDKWTPNSKANPSTYHDSAHCLRFSKLWYTVYQLSEPILDHTVFIKIFEKQEGDNGNTEWVDLTNKNLIDVDALNSKYEDKDIIVNYNNNQRDKDMLPFAINPKQKRLLIPQVSKQNKFTLNEHGPAEYLVVDAENIDPSGERCNTAGVGYSAFYNQPQRCSVSKGSCLQNQPIQLRKQDMERCKNGEPGQYMLKNFAVVPDDALRVIRKSGDDKFIALHYSLKHKSTLDIDIKADDNIIFSGNPVAKITEIYVDSTSDTITILIIKIHNNGLTSNTFHPILTDCPLELPVDWGNLEGDPILIPPQRHAVYTLRLLGILPVDNFFCTVEALSHKNEIVAARRFRIAKSDRCICSWHCLCACYKKTGLACVLMSMEHYRAAGFIGAMPLTTNMVQVSYLENVMFGFFFFVLLIVIILLLMGLTKALIGYFFFVPVGIWGLDMLIGVRRMDKYYEEELYGRQVICDIYGWPVHPDTKARTVRIVDEKVEFCLNLIFFFTYPIMLLVLLLTKLCCPFYSYEGDEDKGAYFQGVSTVAYTKCLGSKASSDSDCYNADMFEFEEDVCSD